MSNQDNSTPVPASEEERHFRLAIADIDSEIVVMPAGNIQDLALRVRALVHVTRLAVRDVHDGCYKQSPEDMPAIDEVLNVTFELAQELYSQIGEIRSAQSEA